MDRRITVEAIADRMATAPSPTIRVVDAADAIRATADMADATLVMVDMADVIRAEAAAAAAPIAAVSLWKAG
jgi:hypothetical protein